MRKMLMQILSFLLIAALMTGPLTPVGFAAWEDGQECWLCGHYHWDEYMCGMCGACSAECTNANCCVATHCNECGTCLETEVFCTECRHCESCYLGEGWHCNKCQDPTKCFYTNESGLCGSCWGCEDCVGTICDSCGFCEDCQESEGGMHCPDCGNCYASVEECRFDSGTHCEECCVICETCEACLYEDGIFLCDYCGQCPDCCLAQAEEALCDCGQYCTESAEWFEHLCAECGIPFCQTDQCEYCGYCLDCSESYSDCIDGMCTENPDYDYHFCEDCGDCFDINDPCESCFDAGDLRCTDCCTVLTEDAGCDCGDRCLNEDDFQYHVTQEHRDAGSANHAPTPKSQWLIDATGHWHECRYCDQTDHSRLDFQPHDLNKYGICATCGFDLYAKILILKQPGSHVVKVSDYNAVDPEDPLHEKNNQVSFTVAAKGLYELRYQWYVSYGGSWVKLTDNEVQWWDSPHSYFLYDTVLGSDTPTLKVSVPVDACYSTISYKCVITDTEGNQVESIPASIRSPHLYQGAYTPQYGELYDTIAQYGDNIPVYHTSGHWISCIGDGCEEYKLVPHRFSKETRILVNLGTNIYGVPMGDGSEWIEYTCLDCGGKKYEKKHQHYFVDPVTGECDIDYSYEDPTQHRMQCLFTHKGVRCSKTTLEDHGFMGIQDMGTPHTNYDGIGISYRECQVCSYQDTARPEYYDPAQDKMVKTDWTVNNDLIYVQFGYASADIARPGDQLYITFSPTDYEKLSEIGMTNPVCLNWRVYYVYEKTNGAETRLHVSGDFIMTRVAGKPTWTTTLPTFAGYTGGGLFIFEPSIDNRECTHRNGTRISGAYDPICVKDGYTGDAVCVDCGHVMKYGEVIPSLGKHTGVLTLNPLTVRQGSCEHRGYSGTSRCSVCKMAVQGQSTPKQHTGTTTLTGYTAPTCYNFGYSGDIYCSCGDLLKEGTLLAPEHSDVTVINYVSPTASRPGYSGDLKCNACDVILKYGYTIPAERIINTITITDLVEPVPGQLPTYEVTLGDDTYSLDPGATSYRRNGIYWYNNYVPLHTATAFMGGYTYRVNIVLKAEGANFFAGDVKATVNGQQATVTFHSDPRYVTVQFTFNDIPKTTIHHVDITDVAEPSAGQNASWLCKLDHPDLYYVDEFTWTENEEYFGDGTFTAGNRYTLSILLCANWNQCVFAEDVTVSVNGRPAKVLTVNPDVEGSVWFMVDFGICGESTISGTVTSGADPNELTFLQLIPEGALEAAYEAVVQGNDAPFKMDAIAPGRYTLRILKKYHAVLEIPIVFDGTDMQLDIALRLAGDPTGDHKVNMKDWVRIYNHINEADLLTDYDWSCADVNGDGKVNMKDWIRLYNHINEVDPLW